MRYPWIFLVAWCIAGCQSTSRRSSGNDFDFDVGGFHRAVTTSSKDAQLWFDRGLALTYGFNHEEAVRCFEKAADLDPSCAMAYWGKAYALGPNVNNPSMSEEASKEAYDCAQKAVALADRATAAERDLIHALSTRYFWPAPKDRAEYDVAFARAMRRVHAAHPEDPDVAALFAESLLDLNPWKWWTKDGVPAEEIPEAVKVIESALKRLPDHPGLCHFYIHAVEESPHPDLALAAADRLRNRVPCAGHLVHMPAHIDLLLGRYPEAILANQRALEQDRMFVKLRGRMNFYTLYRVHNYHFVAYSSMFDGQSRVAMEAARELVREVPEELLAKWPDFLDAFIAMPMHVMVRFGKWEDILSEAEPPEPLCVTRTFFHYARGLAFAVLGRLEEAERERQQFAECFARVPESRLQFNNTARQLLVVAEVMLEGEIEYRRGNHEQAFELLREAVNRDDALNYDEPWGWPQPSRHSLGALLIEQKRFEEAEQVYRQDLQRRPHNAWSLHGLAECLHRTGREAQALETEALWKKAWKRADVELRASCFCRTGSD